jgi:N-terminal acetyltransferase B complex non-catalytic subunit
MDIILKSGGQEKMNPVRLNYLQNSFLGPDSAIAKGEWQLWRLKLELLKNEPELLFEMTRDLLKRARRKDDAGQITESRFSDWVVWKSYVDAASTNKSKYKEDVEAEIKAHLDPQSGVDKAWRRNASLALLRFAFKSTPFSKSDMSGHCDLDLIVQYLQQYGDANIAYTDLRSFIPLLGFRDLARFLSNLVENEENPNGESHAKSSVVQGPLDPLNQNVSRSTLMGDMFCTHFNDSLDLTDIRHRLIVRVG